MNETALKVGAKSANFRQRIRDIKDKRVKTLKKVSKTKRQDALDQRRMIVGSGYASSKRMSSALLPFGKYALVGSQLDRSKLALKTVI